MNMIIKPGVTASGFRTAVRDYTEHTVVEELAANSYDADAGVVVVLLDSNRGQILIIDNGVGFSAESFENIATLGGGDKTEVSYSKGKRHYLGSYGVGLKSTLNIATKIEVHSFSADGEFKVEIDWSKLEEALKPNFSGYPHTHASKAGGQATGTIIKLTLKSPAARDQLQRFGDVLANLPSDGGDFTCYFGAFDQVASDFRDIPKALQDLSSIAKSLAKKDKLFVVGKTVLSDLEDCEVSEITDKNDKSVKAKFYFAGFEGPKVKSLKPSVRGIYVRIHGRLLKQNFAIQDYTYNISKWIMFTQGLRVEIDVDWLRDQITLSREGLRFANSKLQEEFKGVIYRLVSRFIQPHLKKIAQKKEKLGDKLAKQRRELAEERAAKKNDLTLKTAGLGFCYKPETDAELAMLLSQREVMEAINRDFQLLDYNASAPFDALIWDSSKRRIVNAEFEPTLMEFLEHRDKDDIQIIFVWSTGKWRMGARKKGRGGVFELIGTTPKKKGCLKLLEYASQSSKKPRKDYEVIVVEELLE